MKNALNSIYDFLIAWAEAMHEYRNRKGNRNGGYYWSTTRLRAQVRWENCRLGYCINDCLFGDSTMMFLDTLIMLLRWKQDGWEVHPIVTGEFEGWF